MIRPAPDAATISGRLKLERERLGLSQPAMASLAGATKSAIVKWEGGKASPNAAALAAWADAGADVLYVIAGRREGVAPPAEPLAGVTARQALAMLDPVDRHRLLLDLLADELRG